MVPYVPRIVRERLLRGLREKGAGMPGYNSSFDLSIEDMELIETALPSAREGAGMPTATEVTPRETLTWRADVLDQRRECVDHVCWQGPVLATVWRQVQRRARVRAAVSRAYYNF